MTNAVFLFLSTTQEHPPVNVHLFNGGNPACVARLLQDVRLNLPALYNTNIATSFIRYSLGELCNSAETFYNLDYKYIITYGKTYNKQTHCVNNITVVHKINGNYIKVFDGELESFIMAFINNTFKTP
jgi:hypothetical protein